MPLLPVNSGVVLPGMVVSVTLDSSPAVAAVAAAGAGDGRVVVVPRVSDRYAQVGTLAQVEQEGRLPGGARAAVVRGLQRASIGQGSPGDGDALFVEVEPVATEPPSARARELAREYRAVLESILEHRGGSPLVAALRGVTDPSELADTGGYSPDLSFEQKVELLETVDVERRLERVLEWSRDLLAEISLKDRIRSDVTEGMEKTQREFLLRQQLAAIRRELGEDSDDAVSHYRERLDETPLPEAARTTVAREVDRLERTSEQSPEHGWIRTWLDTIFELPWGNRSEDRLEIADARRVLDEDHEGLSDVKERVLEHLAVQKLRSERNLASPGGRGSGAILALVGPPGVGKTSLGESVARALGRRFVRVALGGVRDEADIRGHRRTYVGAQAGRIASAIREAGTMNPVMVLDEVDKLGADWRGDPTSALLEVLDPAQNHTFRDHYLEVELDLSDVLFLATGNVTETVPPPLLDRLEVIRLDGYTEDEKVAIALHHLLPRQRERAGLLASELEVTEPALHRVVTDYTREAGVRNVERELAKLARKVATAIAGGTSSPPVRVDDSDVRSYLGRPRFFSEDVGQPTTPGVATGLAVTGAGGDVLSVEAAAMDGAGAPGLTLTGQLGEVMRESAEIALSYLRSQASALGLSKAVFEGRRFHVHVPAGAVPKDGPSAGITITTALASLLTGRPVRPSVAMTGEVTLQGRVLPIGGVKQKLLAAHRSGMTEVILPARNQGDLEDVPEAVREALRIHLVENVSDVLEVALSPTVEPGGAEPVEVTGSPQAA
jgi:ATP-dependent Lon protease